MQIINIGVKPIKLNFTEVKFFIKDNLTRSLYFSYETIIGFSDGVINTICENKWSNTTGKHLSYLGHKSNRLPTKEFEKRLKEFLKSIFPSIQLIQ